MSSGPYGPIFISYSYSRNMHNATIDMNVFFRVDGLHAIIITDRDGVPVLKGESNKGYFVITFIFLVSCDT